MEGVQKTTKTNSGNQIPSVFTFSFSCPAGDMAHWQMLLCVHLVGALSQYNSQSVSRREVFHLPTEVSTRTNVSHTMLNDPYFSGISPTLLVQKLSSSSSFLFNTSTASCVSPQRAWWWPRSTQRPVACWPVRSPRRWFRGASSEERPSLRSCSMIPKVFFLVWWLDEFTFLGISECQHTSRACFFFCVSVFFLWPK